MNYGLDIEQFRSYVIRPAIQRIGLQSAAAENLLLGTAMQESRLTYLAQLGRGPALGVFQMEPATHDSLWKHSIPGIRGLDSKLHQVSGFYGYDAVPPAGEMVANMAYAAAMARVRYLIAPAQLPFQNDPYAMASYWKRWYNTPDGKGTVDEALPHFQRACKIGVIP